MLGDRRQLGPRFTVVVEWEPRDLWIGIYWTHEAGCWWHVYLCIVPCCPLHVWWRWPLEGGA